MLRLSLFSIRGGGESPFAFHQPQVASRIAVRALETRKRYPPPRKAISEQLEVGDLLKNLLFEPLPICRNATLGNVFVILPGSPESPDWQTGGLIRQVGGVEWFNPKVIPVRETSSEKCSKMHGETNLKRSKIQCCSNPCPSRFATRSTNA